MLKIVLKIVHKLMMKSQNRHKIGTMVNISWNPRIIYDLIT